MYVALGPQVDFVRPVRLFFRYKNRSINDFILFKQKGDDSYPKQTLSKVLTKYPV
jgi:hypothetical protein